MATEKEEIIYSVKTEGVDEAGKKFDDLADGINDTGKATKEVTKETKTLSESIGQLGGGIGSTFTSLKDGATKGISAMKTLSGAMAATGIGLLLVAVASLKTYFTSTGEGAKTLEKIMAVMGSTMGVLTRVMGDLGGIIVRVFSDPLPYVLKFVDVVKGLMLPFNTLYHSAIALGKALTGDFKGAAIEFSKISDELLNSIESITSATNDLIDSTKKYSKEIVDAGNVALEITRRERELRKLVVEDRLEDASNLAKLSELREKYTDSENNSLEERKKAFKEYSRIRTEDAEGQLEISSKLLFIEEAKARENFKNTKDELALSEELATAREKFAKDNADIAELNRFLNKEERRLNREARAEESEENKKILEQKKLIADANAKTLADAEKLRLDEIQKQAQAEIDQFTGTSEELLRLKIIQAEQLAIAERDARDKIIKDSAASEEVKQQALQESELARMQDFNNKRIQLEIDYETSRENIQIEIDALKNEEELNKATTQEEKFQIEIEQENERSRLKLEKLKGDDLLIQKEVLEHNAKISSIERAQAEYSVKVAQSRTEAVSDIFGNMYDLLSALGLKESKAAKAFAVAQLAVDTGKSISNTMTAITSALEEVPYPLNFAAAASVGLSGAATIAANVAKASQLLKAPAPSTSVSSTIGSTVRDVQQIDRVRTTQTNPSQAIAATAFQNRVYVTESDLRASKTKTDVVESQARL